MHRAVRRPPRTLLALAAGVLLSPGCHGHGPGEPQPGGPGLPDDIAAQAAFDPAAVQPGPPPKPGANRPLDVADHGPEGRSEGGAEIHVRFNQPVVALDLRDGAGLDKLFTIDPPLPGAAFWKTPELLVFQPTSAPLPCHSYRVRFNGGIVGLDGQRFDRVIDWSFETVRPTVVGSIPASEPAREGDADLDDGSEGEVQRRDSVVLVHFDRPVALKEVQAHVTAATRPLTDRKAAWKSVPVRVRVATKKEREQFYYGDGGERQVYAVKAAGLWPGGSDVEVSVTPGLRSEDGPLPLDTPWSMLFRTYSAQALVSINCPAEDPCGLEPISLRLRNPIEARQVRKISVTPRPKFLAIQAVDDWGAGAHEVLIEGQFVPGTTYDVRVPAELRDIYGQSIAGGLTRRAVIAPRATLALSAGDGILSAAKPQTVGVESRHVTAIHVRAGVYTDAELQSVSLAPEAPASLAFPARTLERDLKLSVSGKADWSSIALDLADLSGRARRPVMVEVSASELSPRAASYGLPKPVRGVFRLTDLGPLATVSLPASSVQVLRLSTGAPVPGASVYRFDAKQAGKLVALGVTDVAGMLALPANLVALPNDRPDDEAKPERPVRLTIVDPAADDHAHLDLVAPYLRSRRSHDKSEEKSPLRPGERLIAKIVSERGVYRPGEKVRVVGWSAVDTPFARSNLGRLKPGTAVEFELVDNFSKVVATHKTRTTGEGKFWAELPLPAEASLGRYTVRAALAGARVDVAVKVEDYRVPEYTVEARARRTDILSGQQTPIDVHASYYFGGPVQILRVSRSTECHLQRHRPPGLEDIWDVGEPLPYDRSWSGNSPRVVEGDPQSGAPAAPGKRELQAGSNLDQPRYPQRCTVSVEVQDASLQGIGAEAGFAVHPAAFYLAIAPPRGRQRAGDRVRVPLRAVSPQGERMAATAVSLAVTRRWYERSYRPEGGKQVFDKWVERSEKIKGCELSLAAAGADAACALPPLVEGSYELRASATEPGSTRVANSVANFHVAPKLPVQDTSWRSAPIERLEVLVSQRQVKPGDTLEVAVRAPWPNAHGTLVLARGGIREALPVALVDKEALFKFTVDDTWTPDVHFQATIVKPPAPTSNYDKPYVHRTSVEVTQGHEHRRLKVAVDAPGKAGPGERVPLRVKVRDEQDNPTAARVALWAVDEAVLDLTQYEVPDLLPTFIPDRYAEITPRDDYASLLHPYVPQPEDPWFSSIHLGSTGASGYGNGSGSAHGGVGGRGASGPPPARSRFETTPVFLADLAVGADGEASVQATLPDNLTTFRITAVASARLVDGSATGRFGKNDARTVVTAPLVLRGALPRQLRPGDTAEVAAIVQNNTGAAGRLQVTARVVDGTGPSGHVLKVTSPAGASAEVADGGQARLVFAVQALGPGAPQLELQASLSPAAGGEPIRDGLRLPIPVAAERTLTERVAAYGTISDDQAIAVPIKIPSGVLPAYGGVTVDTSSTLLGGLEDAAHALVAYPYGCIEQTASRLLPLIALHQLDKNYPLGVPDPAEFMRAGVERILAMQTSSGGFTYWPGGAAVHVYASAYATWVLHLASKAGYPVPPAALTRALDHLEARVTDLDLAHVPVDWAYGDGVRVAIALHTLADAGRDVGKPAATLYTLRQQLPLFARAFLLMALHRADPKSPSVRTLHSELLGNLTELPATAHTSEVNAYAYDEHFGSDGRSDAITLMALLRVQPDHPVIVKLARGLLERRIGGAWRNTQENAYALVALVDYARVYEAELPDFSARAWVGGANVLDLEFKGRELTTKTSFTDMAAILALSQKPGAASEPLLPVVLQRQGQGRLYYRLGAEWAPAQADLPARAQGFTVTRRLRTSSGSATDVVPAGQPVAMDITIRSETRVRYVVLDVPLPAGLEGVSRTLGRGRAAATLGGSAGWWVSHEEQRPDRVVVFADDLPPGTHGHTIDLRSTSRGRFSFPPALAEAMYMPEVYGRTVGATLEVR